MMCIFRTKICKTEHFSVAYCEALSAKQGLSPSPVLCDSVGFPRKDGTSWTIWCCWTTGQSIFLISNKRTDYRQKQKLNFITFV